MADAPIVDIPITGEVSANEADLNAKIDSELGIAPAPTKPTDPVVPEVVPDEPAVPPDEPEVEPETPEEEPEPEAKPVPTTPATPSDDELFIEVQDADGVTHKISVIEDLPEDFSPKSNRQALEILSQLSKLETQREAAAASAATAAETAALKETQDAQFKSWDAEVAELAKTERLDTTNTERINDVFGYMNEINAARAKAGNPNLITSFEDALDKFEVKEARDKSEADAKNGNDTAKAKSALIGKSSASAGGDTYVYRAGSARNIDEIPL